MRQIGAENTDPLKRIQAEINEVEQREREHRAKLASSSSTTVTKAMLTTTTSTSSSASSSGDSDFVDDSGIDQHSTIMSPIGDSHSSLSSTPDKDHCNDSVSAFSDDSGISSASSPINGQSANECAKPNNHITPKYIRLNTVQNTISASVAPKYKPPTTLASGVASKIIRVTRTTSTPHIFVPGANAPRFQINPAKKGLMQRFIATRGKIAALNVAAANSTNNINTGNQLKSNNDVVSGKVNGFGGKTNDTILTSLELNRPPAFLMNTQVTSPPIIERDSQGRPIRRGFIPVEEKIQKELRDLRSRETELKRMRRQNEMRQSQPNLLDCVDSVEFDSAGDDSDDEHCYMPAKLRTTKSIGELCDALTNSSLSPTSPRESPSPLYRDISRHGLKPAVSLAQLCDVDPDEAPSSRGLIAQWENIIQQNQ